MSWWQILLPERHLGGQALNRVLSAAEIRAAIKEMLKRKGMSYGELAQALGVSLSTVKRILTREELSLERLFAICEALGLTGEELFAFARNATPQRERYSSEHDAFLAAHPDLFLLCLHLQAGESPELARRRLKLTEAQLHRSLRALEREGLVTISLRGKVRTRYAAGVTWARNGQLQRRHLARLLTRFAEHFGARIAGFEQAEELPENDFLIRMRNCRMKRRTFERFCEEADRLVGVYVALAELEEKTEPPGELEPVLLAAFADRGCQVGSWRDGFLEELTSSS